MTRFMLFAPLWSGVIWALVMAASALGAEGQAYDVEAFVKQVRQPMPNPAMTELLRWNTKVDGYLHLFVLSHDQSHLALSYPGHSVQVWETKTGKLVSPPKLTFPKAVQRLALAPNGQTFCIVGGDHKVLQVETTTGKVIATHSLETKERITSLAITSDGKWAMVTDHAGQIWRINLLDGKITQTPPAHQKMETLTAISKTGKHATFWRQQELQIVELAENGEVTIKATTQQNNFRSLAITDQMFAFAASSAQVHIADIAGYSNDKLRSAPTKFYPTWIQLSDDSSRLLLYDSGKELQIHDARDPKLMRSYHFPAPLKGIAWGSDGQLLATIDEKQEIVLRQIPPLVKPGELFLQDELAALLQAKNYAAIDAILHHFERVAAPFPFQENNLPYIHLVNTLLTKIGPLEDEELHRETLQAWAAERPHSTAVMMMDVTRLLNLAIQIKDDSLAAGTKPTDSLRYRELIAQANKIAQPWRTADKPPVPAFSVLAKLAMDWPAEERQQLFEKLMTQAPRQYDAHNWLARKEAPAFGGEPGNVKAYLTKVADRIGGIEGDAMYARLAYRQSRYFYMHRFLPETELDFKRIRRGSEHLFKTATDGKQALIMAMWLAKFQDDPTDFQQLRAMLPIAAIYANWSGELRLRSLPPNTINATRKFLVPDEPPAAAAAESQTNEQLKIVEPF